MDFRLLFSIIISALSVALLACGLSALRSKKEIGVPLGRLLLSLLPPVIGNLLIISSSSRAVATFGSYLYYIGIDFTSFSLLRYTLAYCNIPWWDDKKRVIVLSVLGLDVAQLLANTVFGHAFAIEQIELYGRPYFRMIPYLPQQLHRVLVYLVLASALVILFRRMTRSSRIHARRYGVIFFTLVVVIIWCSFYVVSRTPLDRSMIGYAVFGLLTYFFSLHYRPVRLLNRIMVDIAAELPDALFFFDDTGNCIWMNKEGRELLDIRASDFSSVSKRLEPFYACGEGTDNWTSKLEMDTEKGHRYYALERRTIRDLRGRIDGSFLNVRDDTQAQLNLKQAAYLSNHDELTGLYTRQYLYERIEETLARTGPETAFELVFVNVSGFKLINDIFGNDFGDKVLQKLARLIRQKVPAGGIYGRIAGDTFGVLVQKGAYDLKKVEKELSGFTIRAGDIQYPVLIHLGVFEVTDRSLDVSVMFERARIAAASLRNDFHTHVAWYDEQMRINMVWEQQITGDLPAALRERQIEPYLQPLVDQSGKVVGAEALVRWNHPEHGFLPPIRFVPIFERNGMIAEVDRYMWRCACEKLAQWPQSDLFISVNISPKDFYFMDVAAELKGLVAEYGVDPRRLRIEITESVVISDVESKVELLKDLRAAGFIVEMDDFGSGYSSLNMLKDMPIDVIKIDMVFLRSAENDAKSAKILRNIINMSTDLSIVPLTEGVETQRQYEDLAHMGCQLFQGYYFSKPVPVKEFEAQYVA